MLPPTVSGPMTPGGRLYPSANSAPLPTSTLPEISTGGPNPPNTLPSVSVRSPWIVTGPETVHIPTTVTLPCAPLNDPWQISCDDANAPDPVRPSTRTMTAVSRSGSFLICSLLRGWSANHSQTPPPVSSALHGDARELFDAREAGGDLGETVVPHRLHAARQRRPLDLLARRVTRGERREILGHREELVDPDSPLVPGLVAARAAALPVEDGAVARGGDVGRDACRDQLVDRRLVHLAAVRAELAREPLREDAGHGGAGEERLDAHLVQARERARGVVRVQRREHEVTGERRLDRDLGGLAVADLAHHHHVGVRAQDGPQRGREREARPRVDLHLVDARQPV